MLKSRIFTFIFCIGCLSACNNSSNDNNDTDKPNEAKYLFSVDFFNAAWGHTHKGIVIDSEGNVLHYEPDDSIGGLQNGVHTEDELNQLFSQNQLYLTKIDANTFTEKVTQSSMVDLEQLSDPVNNCADVGTIMYTLFDFNATTSEYSDLLLYQAGDMKAVNNNQYAILLRDWLITLALEYGVIEAGNPCM